MDSVADVTQFCFPWFIAIKLLENEKKDPFALIYGGELKRNSDV